MRLRLDLPEPMTAKDPVRRANEAAASPVLRSRDSLGVSTRRTS